MRLVTLVQSSCRNRESDIYKRKFRKAIKLQRQMEIAFDNNSSFLRTSLPSVEGIALSKGRTLTMHTAKQNGILELLTGGLAVKKSE